MKKTVVSAAALLAAGFLLITWVRLGSSDQPVGPLEATGDRQRIQSFWTSYHQATEARNRGRFEEAVGLYRQALDIDPAHEESLYYLGNSLFEMGLFSDAAEVYRKLSEVNPASQRAFSQLGIVQSTLLPGARTDWESARRAFQRCVEINQEESGPFLRLGLLAVQQGRLEEASQYFDTAAGFRSPEGLFLSGYAQYARGNWEQAMRQFLAVLELDAQEAKITGRGVLSEGDVRSDADAPLTPLQAAALKARLYLYWAAQRLGGYPPDLPESFSLASSAPDESAEERRQRREVHSGGGGASWADFDGDGDLDLAVAGGRQGEFALYQNQRGRLKEVTREAGFPVGIRGSDLAWGDADGDGDLDLLLIRSDWVSPSPPVLFRNDGGGESAPGQFSRSAALAGNSGLDGVVRGHFWDYDGDGAQELVLASYATPALHLLRYSSGQFRADGRAELPPLEGPATDLARGDLDGDGRDDLVLLRWKRPLVVLRNQGIGRFSDVTAQLGLAGISSEALRALLLDHDRDGDLDLLLGSYGRYESALRSLLEPGRTSPTHGLRLFSNSGRNGFADATERSGLGQVTSTMAMAAADFDRDGWPDLILAEGGFEAQRLLPSRVLLNRKGRFEDTLYLPSFAEPRNAEGVAAADLDGDGRLEVFLAGAGLFETG